MTRRKQYADAGSYEVKLGRVMERLGVTQDGLQHHEYNWDRHSAWIQFAYKGELYRFEQNALRAQERGLKLQYGTDCFAQLVLALEDLARMVERGIYDLSTWVVGMKCLPAPVEVPSFFRQLGFDHLPTHDEYRDRYRDLTHQLHPDAGGNPDDFKALMKARDQAEAWFSKEVTR